MPRPAIAGLVLLAAASLGLAACGDTAEKNDYVDEVNKVTSTLQSGLTEVGSGATANSPDQAAAVFDQFAGQLGTANNGPGGDHRTRGRRRPPGRDRPEPAGARRRGDGRRRGDQERWGGGDRRRGRAVPHRGEQDRNRNRLDDRRDQLDAAGLAATLPGAPPEGELDRPPHRAERDHDRGDAPRQLDGAELLEQHPELIGLSLAELRGPPLRLPDKLDEPRPLVGIEPPPVPPSGQSHLGCGDQPQPPRKPAASPEGPPADAADQAQEADDGSRTRYLELGKLALYQVSYVRVARTF